MESKNIRITGSCNIPMLVLGSKLTFTQVPVDKRFVLDAFAFTEQMLKVIYLRDA